MTRWVNKIKHNTTTVGLILLGSLTTITVLAATSYNIPSYVINSGSGEQAGSNFQVRSIIGQSISTPLASFSSNYRFRSGYIAVIHPGSSSEVDTDNDGIPDSYEVNFGLNPLDNIDISADFDGDGLTNLEEYTANTDPNVSDSDNDGMSDGYEVDNDLNPNDSSDCPSWMCGSGKAWLYKLQLSTP